MAMHTRLRLTTLLALAYAVSGAQAQQVLTTQDRALAKLQTQLSKDPNNFHAIRAVGFKLFELKRFGEARPLLEQAQRMRPKDGMAALYLGMSAEEMKDLSAARVAYGTYLETGRDRKTKAQISARIIAISREELKQTAAAAVANEQGLRGQQVDGKTVAVLPFRCVCDSTYKPLERGLAELVVTDLSVSRQLRVLERDRMQAIADEIRLSTDNQVDAQTATRAGKLIQAGTIVNGSISVTGQQNMTLASAMVNTTSGDILPNSPSVPNGTLNALFDAEKEFVLGAFRALNVTLLASELKLFQKRPTQNLEAFLAFSRGLMAQDAGRLDEARALFESARSMDPGFGQALQRANQAAQAQQQAQTSTSSVDQTVRTSTEGQAVAAASTGATAPVTTNSVLANVVASVNPTTTNTAQSNTTQSGGATNTTSAGSSAPPTTQNTVSQATGTDQPAQRVGQVTIVIKRP